MKNRVHIEPAGLGAEERHTSAEGSAAERLTKALKIACLYAGGMSFGEFNDGVLSFADIRDLIDENARLRSALAPFARVAGPIKGEDGRPTYLDLIIKDGGTEELAVTTIFDTGGRGAVLWAEDFREARAALAKAAPAHASQSDVTASEGEVSPGTNS